MYGQDQTKGGVVLWFLGFVGEEERRSGRERKKRSAEGLARV
jgi:hypothetical protein